MDSLRIKVHDSDTILRDNALLNNVANAISVRSDNLQQMINLNVTKWERSMKMKHALLGANHETALSGIVMLRVED